MKDTYTKDEVHLMLVQMSLDSLDIFKELERTKNFSEVKKKFSSVFTKNIERVLSGNYPPTTQEKIEEIREKSKRQKVQLIYIKPKP